MATKTQNYTFTVRFIEVTGKKDGKTYRIPKIENKSGKLIDCRFCKDCNFVPTDDCTIEVAKDDYNLFKPTEPGKFWCYNIHKIIRVTPIQETEDAI